MIISFGDKDTQKIWEGVRVKSLSTEIQELGRRKLSRYFSRVLEIEIHSH